MFTIVLNFRNSWPENAWLLLPRSLADIRLWASFVPQFDVTNIDIDDDFVYAPADARAVLGGISPTRLRQLDAVLAFRRMPGSLHRRYSRRSLVAYRQAREQARAARAERAAARKARP